MKDTMMNGTVNRKSLSTQIDRLDGILDGLADALNEAVAGAVRDVVGQVVRDAVAASIQEVLASPELLRAALARHEGQTNPAEPVPTPRKGPGLMATWMAMLANLGSGLVYSACGLVAW